jgi:hypothetical protein
MKNIIALLMLLALRVGVCAQEGPPHAVKGSILDAVGLPGQMWSANGIISPVEKGNVLSMSYFEQEVTVYSTWRNSVTLTPYGSFGMSFDSKGYPWNNKVQPSGGLKLNKFFRNGVISVGTAYSYEDRFSSSKDFKASGRTDYIQYWFGWNPVSERNNRLPGSTWIIAGHYSPVEHGNLIEEGYVTQGVVAKRFGRTTLIPYGEFSLVHDSKGFDWENKAIPGFGAKLGVPSGEETYTEVGVGYLHENRFNSGLSANGVKIFMNFNVTWGLFGRKGR